MLNEHQSSGPKLSVRVGIDSGAVVVGTRAGQAVDAFGDAAIIAAQVQGSAEPGTVVVTGQTHRLISGLFVVEDRGAHQLKGVERPVQLYRLVRPSGMRSRFEAAAAARGLTPFVGREDELRLLLSRWERAREGNGQVALIIGEAGIGKSRLVGRFHEQLAGTPHSWFEAGAGAFFQSTPFYPISELLRQSLIGGTAQEQLAELAGRLIAVGLQPDEAIPLIAPILNLSLPPENQSSSLPPEQQRRRLLATLLEWLLGSARTQPLVSVIEDLHWADPSTLELIQLLVEQGATAPLLLIYTCRPEFRVPWRSRSHHARITLNRLSAREVRAMVGAVAARKAMSDETIATVVERIGGVPLFIEELTHAVLESGDGELIGRSIPVTLRGSLMARLDQLGPAKEVAQLGAVIGGEFSYELLRAVNSIPEEDLQNALRSLTDAELLYVRGLTRDASYQFKHALIRDTAYETLLKSRRRELHKLVAQTIAQQFATIKEAHPEVLARHWTEAGETKAAITEWRRAAERALEKRAYREAEQSYRNALTLLAVLPESHERDTDELSLQLALGSVMLTTQGWSAATTDKVYERSKALADKMSAESIQMLYGMWATSLTQGELRAAQLLGLRMLEIANSINSSRALVIAHHCNGVTRLIFGELSEARRHYLEAVERYRAEEFRDDPEDHGGAARTWLGMTEWLLGYPNQAIKHTEEARSFTRRLNKPFAIAYADMVGAWIDGITGNFDGALASARNAERLGTELGFPMLRAGGKILGYWASANAGQLKGAVESIRSGIAELDAIKFFAFRGLFLILLAQTQALTGNIDDALASVRESLEGNPDELWFRPLALTLRGELLERIKTESRDPPISAEQDFRDAIEMARNMGAKSLELRAAIGLAGSLLDSARSNEARTMLASIYNSLTEGFDLPDLKDAKALLDELSN